MVIHISGRFRVGFGFGQNFLVTFPESVCIEGLIFGEYHESYNRTKYLDKHKLALSSALMGRIASMLNLKALDNWIHA